MAERIYPSRKAPRTLCDHCGDAMPKAHAVYDGQAYCHQCYTYVFEEVECEKCGLPMRTPYGKKPAVCKTCLTKDRHCVRCGKETPRAGLIVEDGAVCPSCAKYFREPKPCTNCGRLSIRLSRDVKNGFNEPVCEQCRRKNFVTCAECGKHRRAVGINFASKAICASCAAREGAPFICPQCRRPGRQHSKDKCDRCYWDESAGDRLSQQEKRLKEKWVIDEYHKFFDDIFDHMEGKVVSLRLERYTNFFVELESNFEGLESITYRGLYEHFGARFIKHNSVIVSHFIRRGILEELSSDDRVTVIEEIRQDKLLSGCDGLWFQSVLINYRDHLEKVRHRFKKRGWSGKRKRMIPETVTVSLKAAYQFLKSIPSEKISDIRQVTQVELDRFLADKPGYKDTIRNFIRYLNRESKLFQPLKVEWVAPPIPADAFLGDEVCSKLLKDWLCAKPEDSRQAVIGCLLLLYAQKVNVVVKLKLSDLLQNEDGMYTVAFGRTEIQLDQDVSHLMDRYMEVRRGFNRMEKPWENPYLFPGQIVGSHLSPVTVSMGLNKLGLKTNQLFSTAILNAIRNGITHPKVLVNALGISNITAMKYLNYHDPRLVSEIVGKVKKNGQ